jgi:hypothetical protein
MMAFFEDVNFRRDTGFAQDEVKIDAVLGGNVDASPVLNKKVGGVCDET